MRNSTNLLKTLLFCFSILFLQNPAYSSQDFIVKFIRVIADQVDDEVRVRWVTESEYNNNYFTVQRSIDGGFVWQDLGIVEGSGTSPGAGTYMFVDENPSPGSITYRLRQTDLDGTYTYSFVAEVNVSFFSEEEEAEVQLYPNPSDGEVAIQTENFTGTVNVQLMDLTGKMILINQNNNDGKVIIRPINKIYGLYFLMISDEHKSIMKKIKFE